MLDVEAATTCTILGLPLEPLQVFFTSIQNIPNSCITDLFQHHLPMIYPTGHCFVVSRVCKKAKLRRFIEMHDLVLVAYSWFFIYVLDLVIYIIIH